MGAVDCEVCLFASWASHYEHLCMSACIQEPLATWSKQVTGHDFCTVWADQCLVCSGVHPSQWGIVVPQRGGWTRGVRNLSCCFAFVMDCEGSMLCNVCDGDLQGWIRTAVHRRKRGGGVPPPPRTPLLPFQCLRLTAKVLLRRLRRQDNLSLKIVGTPSAVTIGGPKEDGGPSQPPPLPLQTPPSSPF